MTRLNREKLASAALIVGVFVVWELACLVFGISEFVLPRPSQIVMVLIDRWPALMPHAVQTLYTTLVGFALGVSAGILIGMVLGWLFHGVLTATFNFLLVAALLVPFILAFLFWRKVQGERQADVPPPPAPYDPSLTGGPAMVRCNGPT